MRLGMEEKCSFGLAERVQRERERESGRDGVMVVKS
jgi:hypothetical protein